MGAKLSEAQERLLKRLADGQQKIHYGYPPRKFLIENGFAFVTGKYGNYLEITLSGRRRLMNSNNQRNDK